MSETALRIAPRDESVAAPRRQPSATLNHLASPAPLEEYEKLGAEITEDVERLKAKIATKNALELHLKIAGTL